MKLTFTSPNIIWYYTDYNVFSAISHGSPCLIFRLKENNDEFFVLFEDGSYNSCKPLEDVESDLQNIVPVPEGTNLEMTFKYTKG